MSPPTFHAVYIADAEALQLNWLAAKAIIETP